MTKYLFDSLGSLKGPAVHTARVERLKLMDAIREGQPEQAEKLARNWTEQARNWLLNKLN
jgi:DNA-binding FadR family transcriptional regulator